MPDWIQKSVEKKDRTNLITFMEESGLLNFYTAFLELLWLIKDHSLKWAFYQSNIFKITGNH